ncbi:hypothetical protein [Iodobacter fluviatilis]|uniref:Uncharacterized protein n=1 Tax=Iodobacter fluviatilis TaxID=537 RepID=A0A377Q981_9NEIS|nr:hypothetical protein [Iodobacter fluviatilis]TCU88562.1 hypothetical protein EV682_103146 [Iodobacter fluviatilis]STQ91367.1 Uncharacterised protein [Iodobacter fluviatilis]
MSATVLKPDVLNRENEALRRLRGFGVPVLRVIPSSQVVPADDAITLEIDAHFRKALRNVMLSGMQVRDVEGVRVCVQATQMYGVHILWREAA